MLRETMDTWEKQEDLDEKGHEILYLLKNDGKSILKKEPRMFNEMIAKAHCLIASSMYTEIIQKMAEIYKTIPERTESGPLECLVQQLYDKYHLRVLRWHQEKLLSLIQILMAVDDSPYPRTRCLRTLILISQYGPRRQERLLASCFKNRKDLEWTEQLIEIVRLLLEGGADPSWIPETLLDRYFGSALYPFFQRIIRIVAEKNHLTSALMALLPWFLTDQCFSHREPRGPGSLLHAVVGCDWGDLPEDLPEDFFGQCKGIICQIVASRPLLLDMADGDGQNPLQCFIGAIAKHKDFIRIVKDVVSALTEEHNREDIIHARDRNGQTVLHILVDRVPEIGHEKLIQLVSCLKSSSSIDTGIQDNSGQTVLHILAGKVSEIGHEAFLELVHCLELTSCKDTRDENGETVLHILARSALDHQRSGPGLLAIFPHLTTEGNVNVTDNDLVSPLSWILTAKARWETSKGENAEVFSKISDFFLSKDADANIARAALFKPLYRWAGEELSDEDCTTNRLQWLLNVIIDLSDWKSHSYIEEFDDQVWMSLWNINNAKFLPAVIAVFKILTESKCTAQKIWTSMMEFLGNATFCGIEILCLCAERGAQHTEGELRRILSETDDITKNKEVHGLTPPLKTIQLTDVRPIARNKELAISFLQTLIALHKNKPFKCDLQFLGDFYNISEKIIQLGRKLVQCVYESLDDCFKSNKLIDYFLFISHEKEMESPMDECFIESSFCQNWLQRSPLHLAAILLDNEISLKSLPQTTLKDYLHAKDIHGSTPLHLAHLHNNVQAIRFLKSNGALDCADYFGLMPGTLFPRQDENSDTMEDHPRVKIKKISHSVFGTNSGVCEKISPMLIMPEPDADALCCEVLTLLRRLVRGTEFEIADIRLAGSLRERLKVGQLDEADIQLRFQAKRIDETFISVEGVRWHAVGFLRDLADSLIKSLAKISWEGIFLRPISVHGPWQLLREGGSLLSQLVISVDVVPIIMYEEDEDDPVIPLKDVHAAQKEVLEGSSFHTQMKFTTLEPWHYKESPFVDTYFAFEWDMIDSLSTSCRVAIVIAKALVEAYNTCKGDSRRVNLSITSYMVKTALFYILAYHSSQLEFKERTDDERESAEALRNALENVEGKRSEVAKLKFNPNPRWTTISDLHQCGEEARVWVWRMFTLIKYLAERGWKLNSFWNRGWPVGGMGFGEADFILDICTYALERIKPAIFHGEY